MAISAYSCINCGNYVRFDITARTFKCVSCQSHFTLEEMNNAFPDEDGGLWEKTNESGASEPADPGFISKADEREATVKIYHCPSCGADLLSGDDTLAAAFCAYCGKPAVISERLLSGEHLPSRVIPFVKTNDEAFGVFLQKTKNKPLAPRIFKINVRPGDFKSVYVPFKLFDAECSARVTATCENVTTWSDSEYNYTQVDTYEARRSGAMDFAQVPIDVSDKIDDSEILAIEPFNMSALLPFSKKYLSGYYAETPTTQEDKLTDTLYKRLKPAAINAMLGTIWGYDKVSVKENRVGLERAESEYVMLPVWILTRSYKGRDYVFAINGQTGKYAGKLPVDGTHALALFVKIALIVFFVAFISLEVFLWIS